MGEEEKKMEENKPEEGKGEKKEQEPKAEGEKEEKKAEESKEPPPPSQEIVLRVYMHCEGCARKVRRCLKGFEGVEDVQTDYRTQKVIVKGEKADPLKVLERVQKKSHRQVELISPIPPPPPPPEEKKEEGKEVPKPEEKKEEPQVITLVLKVRMHCEACAQEIKRRILRMKGVENVEADLKSSQVTVSGVFDPEKLVEYVYKRTGKHALVVSPEPEKKEEEKPKEVAKKADGGENGEGAPEEKKGGDGEAGAAASAAAEGEDENARVVDVKKNEFHYYNYAQNVQYQMYPYPPQLFSDENPNACSVM